MTTATRPHNPAHEAPAKSGRLGWIVVAGLAIALAAGGWYYHTHGAKTAHGSTADAEDATQGKSSDETIAVATVRLSKGGIVRTSTQIGTVQPFEDADLYSKVSGYLAKLHVDYGDHVKRDQLLAEIDDPEVVEDVKKAAADVLQAKAAVAQAVAFIEAAKADRDASASAIEQAVAEVARYASMSSFHTKKYARYRVLVERKAIPQQIADEEDEALESAKANELASRKTVLKVRADLLASAARVKKAEADLDEAKANVEVSEAKHARSKVFLGYTKIRSPYDGVITKRNFFRGAFIRSASDGNAIPLLTVARNDMVRVVTEVPDRDVPLTNVGDDAEITLDALGGEVLKGKVSRFAETEDPNSRTMHTEIDLPNPKDKIRPGMYGIAKIILDTSTKSSTLPASSLVGESKGGKADVYVIKDGKAKKVQIKIGVDDGLRVEVISGVSQEDEVIANTGSVTEGAPVRAAANQAETQQPTETSHAANQGQGGRHAGGAHAQ